MHIITNGALSINTLVQNVSRFLASKISTVIDPIRPQKNRGNIPDLNNSTSAPVDVL